MKKAEMRKAIENAIKENHAKEYGITLVLWHGDGTYEGRDKIYNEVSVQDNNGNNIYSIYLQEGMEDTPDNYWTLMREHVSLKNYLAKVFVSAKYIKKLELDV